MTKLKNTKKGMAKKALSISLVAAMLATSNVPVWAAEDIFSDSSNVAVQAEVVDEADTFTSEVPAEEEPAADAAVMTATASAVEKNAVLTTDHDGDWSGKLTLAKADASKDAAYTVKDADGNPISDKLKLEVYYNDSMDVAAIENVTADFNNIKTALENIPTTNNKNVFLQGAKVDVKVYVGSETTPIDTLSYNLKPVSVVGETFTVTPVSKDYDGQQAVVTAGTVTVNGVTATVGTDLIVNYKNPTDGVNVGSYPVFAEGQGAFTGITADAANAVTITAADVDKDSLSVVVSGNDTYNGAGTKPSSVVVTDKYTGAVISSDLYNVSSSNIDAGTYDSKVTTSSGTQHPLGVTIELLADNRAVEPDANKQIKNNFVAGQITATDVISGSYVVDQLDLSTLSSKYTISVPAKETATNNKYTYAWTDFTFTDKDGKTIAATDIAPTADVDVPEVTVSAGATSGTVSVVPKTAAAANVKGKLDVTFRIATKTMTKADIRIPKDVKIGSTVADGAKTLDQYETDITGVLNAQVYNGTALEPLKDVFSNLLFTAKNPNGTDAPLVLNRDYTITYTNNTESDLVKGASKKGKLTISFIGALSGPDIVYDIAIAKAEVDVVAENVPYEAGKTSYNASVKVTTTVDGKEVAVPTSAYTVEYLTTGSKVGDTPEAKVTFTNKNYKVDGADAGTDNLVKTVSSTVVGKSLKDTSVTAAIEGTYVYTGKAINPTIVVKDGTVTLKEGTDYKVVSKSGTEAGEASVTIVGMGNYENPDVQLVLKYTITKADIKNAVVNSNKAAGKETNYDVEYNGSNLEPDIKEVKIGDVILKKTTDNGKTGDYSVDVEKNKDIGSYTFKLTALPSSTKVEGTFEGTYKITPKVSAEAFFAKRVSPTTHIANGSDLGTVADYTGKEIKLADLKTKYVLVDASSNVLTEGKDYELRYENNTDAGTAIVKAYGLGNYATVDANGLEAALANAEFVIKGLGDILATGVTKIDDVEYAGGLYVEPKVTVKVNGKTLVQGTDYTVKTEKIEVGEYNYSDVTVIGKGAYTAGGATNAGVTSSTGTNKWKIVKKDMKNTTVKLDGEDVTVMNGSVIVPSSEYDVKLSEDKKTITVTAKASSKNYTGSQEVSTDVKAVGTPVIAEVKVTNNKANIILSGDVDNAIGYDYVVSTVNDYKNGRVAIDKNQPATQSTIQYLQKGEYYAYLHAWKRVDGKKVFGGWSDIVKFTVTTTTPDQPLVTNVTRNGSTVKVTYTKTKNATGYDIVLGTRTKKVNGELRPVEYGKLVKKVYNANTVTVTFKNVPKGTYYAGLHAYNRTSVNNSKVFSPWSNSKKVVVK